MITTTEQTKTAKKAKGHLYRNLQRFMKVVHSHEMGSFFDLHLDMLCIINMDTHFTRVSPAFCNLLGYTEAELLSRPFTAIVSAQDIIKTKHGYNRAKTGKCRSRLEHRCICKDGSEKWISWNVMPIASEDVMYAVPHDITEVKNTQLQIEKYTRELEELILQKEESLRYARHIQCAYTPDADSLHKVFEESFVYFKPKEIVSGDFFWMETISSAGKTKGNDGNLVLMAVADCTGHGVPAAMLTVICSKALNEAVKESGIIDPGEILDRVRWLVSDMFSKSKNEIYDGMDITLCLYDKTTGVLSWSGANTPLYYMHNGTLKEISATKQSIGKYVNGGTFTTHKVKLNKGDILYLFSDGYASQFGGRRGKKFMFSNFRELLSSVSCLPMPEQRKILKDTFNNWRGDHEQIDDVTVVGIKV